MLVLLIFAVVVPMVMSKPKGDTCVTIQDGILEYSAGHYLEGELLKVGYDIFGYNYQAHMFKGYYCNVYLGSDGFPPYDGDDEAYHQRLIDEGFIPTVKYYGDITLRGGFQAGHFDDVWDLTSCDLVISFTYDAYGLVDDFGGGAHAWAELGVRQVGYGDFNPTWMTEGAGVWLATDYDWTANTFDPDTTPKQDLDDKLILQKGGGMGEGAYNLPSTPPNPGANHRVWFDRDGVDQWQALNPLAVDGGTYNTGGRYEIIITLHAIDATSGTAYMTINDLDQGFETDGNWKTMELSPAGMTFTGDMTQMQVFYGLSGYGATHSIAFEDIIVSGCLSGKGEGKGDPYGKWYWPYRDVWLLMKWNDAWLSNKDCDEDAKLDRHHGYDSYIGSGAWETNHQRGEDDADPWTYFVKIVAVPEDADLVDGIWYDADGTEIGPEIWGSFAIIQEVESGEGATYVSPSGPGFGKWQHIPLFFPDQWQKCSI